MAPVFIVGCPRSGTTLVQAVLDAHPDVAIAPETHYAKRFLAAEGRQERGGDGLEGLLDELVASEGFRDTGLDAEGFRQRAWRAGGGAAGVFRELLAAYGESRGARIVGEKTPNHLLHMRLLERALPGARFIHVVRDPRGVCLSMASVPWSKGSVSRDAETWRRYMVAARRGPPHAPDALHEVRFERLVREPEPVVRGLAAFLSIDFRPEMLDPGRPVRGVDLEREPWKRNVGRAIDAANADRWRHALSARQIAAVEAVAYGEMRRLGYRPVTPAWRLVPVATATALRREVRFWRARGRSGSAGRDEDRAA